MKPLLTGPVLVAACEAQWHRPVSFTPGRPGVGVCACGRFVWRPVDRTKEGE